MNAKEPERIKESQQEQIDDLSAQVADAQADLDALQTRVDNTVKRAGTSEQVLDAESRRVDRLEERVDVHEAMIAVLQADGSLRGDQAAQLEQALRTSRIIGAAIGIVMAKRDISDVDAFRALSRASQESNRKLRVIAEEVVRSKDLNALGSVVSSSVDAV